MSILKAGLVATALALLIGGALYLGLTRKVDSGTASSPSAQAPAVSMPDNPAHEKAALEDQLKQKPDHAPILLRLAQIDLAEGRAAGARKRLEELLNTEPENSEALLELGRACYTLDDLACAVQKTEAILKRNPAQPDALYNLGAIYANQGQRDKAREYWDRAAKASPTSDSGKKAAAALKQL